MTASPLKDWCRFSKAGRAYIEPGSPWQNPYVESFGSRVRDELLTVELFSCLAEAQVLVEDWRDDIRPPPATFSARDETTLPIRQGVEGRARAARRLATRDGDTPTLQQNNTHRLSHTVDRKTGAGHLRWGPSGTSAPRPGRQLPLKSCGRYSRPYGGSRRVAPRVSGNLNRCEAR